MDGRIPPSTGDNPLACIDRPRDRRGEHDVAALLQPEEAVQPGRQLGREIRAGDRHQPTARRKPRQRRGDVAIGGVGDATGDVRHDGERRVHDDHAGDGGVIEMIVDLGGVEARDGDARKERCEKIGAGLGQLVQDEIGSSMFTLSSEAKRSAKLVSEKSSTKPGPRTKSTRSSIRRRSMDRTELIDLAPQRTALS